MADNLTTLTTKPLATWSLEDVTVAAKAGLPTTYAVARTMLEDHDYFQNGTLWIGQRAEAGLSRLQIDRIRPVFVPDPLLEEIRENRTNGLLKREPTVAFESTKPTESTEPDDRVTEVVQAIAAWWDRVKFWDKARLAFGRTSYSRRAALRVWIPGANVTDIIDANGQPSRGFEKVATLEAALDRIEIAAPLPDLAGRFTVANESQIAVVLTGDEQNREAELWYVEGGTTFVRVLNRRFGDQMAGKNTLTVPYDLGGRLPVVEMNTAELVTDPVIRQQSLLNFASTVLNRVLETAGFPERYLGNVETPGIWLTSPPEGVPMDEVDEAKDSNGNTIYKHAAQWKFGFQTVAELVGLRTTEQLPNGGTREGFETPFVQRFDPVDPAYIKTASELIRNRIYHLCRQGHLAADTNAEASGLAYQQARAGFEADLETQKGGLEGMVREAIEVVLAYAGLMHAETKAFLEEFRCVVTLHVTSGPVTPDEARLAGELRDKRLISQSTAQGRVGVEDIGAEQTAIDADPGANADQWVKIAAAITALTTISGMSGAAAAFLLGLDEEQQAVFLTGAPPVTGQAITKPTLAA